MQFASSENLERAMRAVNTETLDLSVSDRQRVLMTAGICCLEEGRRLEPNSSLIHHSLANAYWWWSMHGGYQSPAQVADNFSLPNTAKLQGENVTEEDCLQAALWHYSAGTSAEPRNLHIRCAWAQSLQADGRTHEALGVATAALPDLGSCRAQDKATMLRTIGMLHYQAFTRSPLWQQVESGKWYDNMAEAPALCAAMQNYTAALEEDPQDVISVTSLAQIYSESVPANTLMPEGVLPITEVQFRLVELLLEQEGRLAGIQKEDLPAEYRPGQLLGQYRERLRWCFDGLGRGTMSGSHLARLESATSGWLAFVHEHHLPKRPFTRDMIDSVYQACKAYNEVTYFGDYSLTHLIAERNQLVLDP